MFERSDASGRLFHFACVLIVAAGAIASAQGRPKAEVTVLSESEAVHPGDSVRLAVQVKLPDGVHVQSDRPRDPMLIATAVTSVLPPGVTVVETAYPPSIDFTQAGQAAPLAVFAQQFNVGVKVVVAPDTRPGDVVVPLRLRYQACNEAMCFAPAREEVTVSFRVVPASVKTSRRQTALFDGLPFTR